MKVKYAILTNKGLIRSINEDIIDAGNLDKVDTSGVPARLQYMVACDGMGGMKAGETASKLASSTVMDYVNAMPFWPTLADDISDQLKGAVQAAHQNIKMLAEYDYDKNGMGTTIVLLVIVKNIAYITWSGDSRVYLLTEQLNFVSGMDVNGLRLMTKDHAISWNMVEKGLLTIDQVRNHPQSNALTQVLGGECPPSPEFISFDVANNDRLLVCTDGVYLHMDTDELKDMLIQYKDPNQAANCIKDKILSRGAKDNFSLGIVDIMDVQWSTPVLTEYIVSLKNTSQKTNTWYYIPVFVVAGLILCWIIWKEIITKPSPSTENQVSTLNNLPSVRPFINYNDSLLWSIERLNIQLEKMTTSADSLSYIDTQKVNLDSFQSEIVATISHDLKPSTAVIKKLSAKTSTIKSTIKHEDNEKKNHSEKSILYDKLYGEVQIYLNGYKQSNAENDMYRQAYMIRLEQLLFEIKQKKQDNDYTNLTKTNWQLEYLKNKFDMIQSKYQPK